MLKLVDNSSPPRPSAVLSERLQRASSVLGPRVVRLLMQRTLRAVHAGFPELEGLDPRELSKRAEQDPRLSDVLVTVTIEMTNVVRALTGLTPRQLLTKARVEAAAHALRDTTLSAGAIAAQSGFYDQAAFTRQFREATGLAPGQYRAALKSAR